MTKPNTETAGEVPTPPYGFEYAMASMPREHCDLIRGYIAALQAKLEEKNNAHAATISEWNAEREFLISERKALRAQLAEITRQRNMARE